MEENQLQLCDENLRDLILDYHDETDPEIKFIIGCETYIEATKHYDDSIPDTVLHILFQCFVSAKTPERKYMVLRAVAAGPMNESIDEIPLRYIDDEHYDIRTYSFQILCRLKNPEHFDIIIKNIESQVNSYLPRSSVQ